MKLRKWLLFFAALSLMLAVRTAVALELSAGPVTPFDDNSVTVCSDTAGTLTLIPSLPDYDLKPVVTNYPLEAGETVIPWDGLSWHGEPLPSGRLMLNAQLKDTSGVVSDASLEIKISSPLCAAVSCLPAADIFCPKEDSLRIECGLSRKGSLKVEIASAGEPDNVLRTLEGKAKDTVPVVLKWDGKDRKHNLLPEGEYLLTAYSVTLPERKAIVCWQRKSSKGAERNEFRLCLKPGKSFPRIRRTMRKSGPP